MLDQALFFFFLLSFIVVAVALKYAKMSRRALVLAKFTHVFATWIGLGALVFIEAEHFLVIRGLVLLQLEGAFLIFSSPSSPDAVTSEPRAS
mgnify:CR=1 FL=1